MVKKILTNFRYYVLLGVCLVAMIGTFAVPVDDLPLLTWTWVLFSTKVVGFGGFYLFHRLTKRWEAQGTIKELTDFTNSL